MNTISLLQKLQELEQAVGVEGVVTLRRMVADARECALEIQRNSPEQLRRNSRAEQARAILA